MQDADWPLTLLDRPRVEATIAELMRGGTVPGSSFSSIDCRGDECLLEFSSESPEAQSVLGPQLVANASFGSANILLHRGLKTTLTIKR